MAGVRGRSGGSNRLPTAIKEARGTLRKSRLRSDEPVLSLTLPSPPEWLSESGRLAYARLGQRVLLARVVTEVDGDALALAVSALEEMLAADEIVRRDGAVLERTTETGSSFYRHPAVMIRADAWRRYRDALRAFGLDPQSRAGVSAIPEKEASSAAGYFN